MDAGSLALDSHHRTRPQRDLHEESNLRLLEEPDLRHPLPVAVHGDLGLQERRHHGLHVAVGALELQMLGLVNCQRVLPHHARARDDEGYAPAHGGMAITHMPPPPPTQGEELARGKCNAQQARACLPSAAD